MNNLRKFLTKLQVGYKSRNVFIKLYLNSENYNIVNFLLNHDSKNIHPIIDDFINLENDSFFLFSGVCFIFLKIIFIFFFIELGIN